MPTTPTRSTVRRGMLNGMKPADAVAALQNTCGAGAQCPQVQGAAIALGALTVLQTNVTTVTASLKAKQKADQDALTAGQTLAKDLEAARGSLTLYETSVISIADGDASVINKSGLFARDEAPAATPALQAVAKVDHAPGKNPSEARVSWPAAPGATSYALEINLTPQTPSAPWTSAGTRTHRSRVVVAPAPGAQFLARVAAVAGDGTMSAWSAPILATAR